jgi:alkylresorcinol/alkylpyrone synthase
MAPVLSCERSPRLESVATALPPHSYPQSEIKEAAASMFLPSLAEVDHRLLSVFDTAGVETRHFCRPLEWYAEPRGFAETNRVYIESAMELAGRAASRVLESLGLLPQDIDHFVYVSTTGMATPSIDARLMNRIPFRPDLRRTPVWGLGCAGGAAGLARAAELAAASPDSRVLLVALELCSLTFQRGDMDRRNLVACSLFSDGAAAAVIAGPDARPRRNGAAPLAVRAARSTLWQDTLDVMGWDIDGDGLHVIFSRDIPTIVRDRVRPNLETFLGDCALDLGRLDHLLAHPGGPRVLGAYAEALGWSPERLRHSRAVLAECGNMSSPTCLFVLERALRAQELQPHQPAVVTALGPGFASESVLVEAIDA